MQNLERRVALLEKGRGEGCLNCEVAKLTGVKEARCVGACWQGWREALSALNGYPANQLPEQRHAST